MPDSLLAGLPPFTRRLHGLALVLGPLLLLASSVAYMAEGEGINDGVLGGVLGVWSVFVLGLALTGVLRALEPRWPRAAPVLTLLVLAGVAGGTAFNVHAIFSQVFGVGPDALLDTVEGGDTVAVFAFLPWGWMVPITLVATGVLLWRTDGARRATAGLLVAGGVLFVAGRPERIEPVVVLTDLVLIAALVPIGLHMVRSGREPLAWPVPSA